jgi:predicted dehydrogenase
MPETRLRAAIIGAGKIAGVLADPASPSVVTHAHALATTAPFSLDLVIDADGERAAAFAQRWGCPHWGTSLADLEQTAPFDLVAVCVPDRLHAGVLEQLAALPHRPRLVVMEKPLCLSPEELRRLEALNADCSGMAVVVNHSRRFDARYDVLAGLIANGGMGDLVGVRWAYYGGWLHTGPHVIDTVRRLLGGTLEVTAAWPGYTDRPGDPCIEARLTCTNRPQARILIESFPEQAFQLFEAEIRLREGRIRLLDFGAEVLKDEVRVNQAGERELRVTVPFEFPPTPTAMAALYAQAAAVLLNGDTSLVQRAGITDAMQTMETVFAVAAVGAASQ